MNMPFSSTWEGILEYSSQHLHSKRARRATYELSFFKTFKDVRLKIALIKLYSLIWEILIHASGQKEFKQ